MEKCPFCGEELDALTRKVRNLERELEEVRANPVSAEESERDCGEVMYIASSERRTFHRPNCEWASYIIGSINLVEFHGHEEAVAAGYRPCKTCCA